MHIDIHHLISHRLGLSEGIARLKHQLRADLHTASQEKKVIQQANLLSKQLNLNAALLQQLTEKLMSLSLMQQQRTIRVSIDHKKQTVAALNQALVDIRLLLKNDLSGIAKALAYYKENPQLKLSPINISSISTEDNTILNHLVLELITAER